MKLRLPRREITRWSYAVKGATAERFDSEAPDGVNAPNAPRVRINTPNDGLTPEDAELLCATVQTALRIEREGKR